MTHQSGEIEEPTNEELRRFSRRTALKLFGGAGLAMVAACAGSGVTSTTMAGSNPTTGASGGTAGSVTTFGGAGSCVLIPQETAGPFPLDLSADDAFVRRAIDEGRPGVPLTLTLHLVDVESGCAPIEGARVDVWHCDAEGLYSGYPQQGVDTTGETFCRGIQLSDSSGQVTFQTIYPGWYIGRITHVHFQVFLGSGLAATSQIAFPQEATVAVYEVEPYAARGQNTSVSAIEEDIVFRDGSQFQLATLTGGPDTLYLATLLVGIGAAR